MSLAPSIRVYRAGALCGTFAAPSPLEMLLRQPCVQPAAASGTVPCALVQRGAASFAEALQYISGAVPAGEYDILDARQQPLTAASAAASAAPVPFEYDAAAAEPARMGTQAQVRDATQELRVHRDQHAA